MLPLVVSGERSSSHRLGLVGRAEESERVGDLAAKGTTADAQSQHQANGSLPEALVVADSLLHLPHVGHDHLVEDRVGADRPR